MKDLVFVYPVVKKTAGFPGSIRPRSGAAPSSDCASFISLNGTLLRLRGPLTGRLMVYRVYGLIWPHSGKPKPDFGLLNFFDQSATILHCTVLFYCSISGIPIATAKKRQPSKTAVNRQRIGQEGRIEVLLDILVVLLSVAVHQ